MIDYRDFVQQAEIDLDRSTKLYDSADYGFAIFSAQQGLEKYIKAYLLKLDIFQNPKELGHAQYGKILESTIEMMSKRDKQDNFTPILDSIKSTMQKLQNLANDIENKPHIKIIMWKESLKIPFTSNEESIGQGMSIPVLEGIDDLEHNMKNLTSKGEVFDLSFLNNVNQTLLPENVRNVIKSIRKLNTQFNDVFTNPESGQEIMKTLFEMMNQISYGKGATALSKSDTDYIMKGLGLWNCLNWFSIAMKTYPHEEISRYSTDIDGQTSIELYEKYHENLKELINEIRNTCNEINASFQKFQS